MTLKCLSVLMVALLTVLNSAYAGPTDGTPVRQAAASTATVAPSVDEAPHISADLFAGPRTFRGTLGDAKIEMHLQLKPDPTEGLQGTYTTIGQAAKVLLAGEYEGGDVLMEESVNGKDVSGEWSGKFDGTTFSGTWSTTDDTITKPFVLKVLAGTSNNISNEK